MKNVTRFVTIIFVVLGMALVFPSSESLKPRPTKTPKITGTYTPVITITPSRTSTPIITITPTKTVTRTPQANSVPYPNAPLCSSHDSSKWHSLWDSARGCHYDHEHGTSPFTVSVSSAFPGFDLYSLLCNAEIGNCNPSSSMENIHKHGGFKWDVNVVAPNGCITGFEGGTIAVDAYAIQYHSFGRQDIEFEANHHSAVALLRQCKDSNPSDKGYIFVGTLQNYGERCSPYQGQTLQYPDDFLPRWNCSFGPYFTTDNNQNRTQGAYSQDVNSKWTSKITGCVYPCAGTRPQDSFKLFRFLFDIRDEYMLWDVRDTIYPFTWIWMCGNSSYNPVGCRHNNSTSTVHEVMGDIPTEWDNVVGLDSDSRIGRITGYFFVDNTGTLKQDCVSAGSGCYPVKLVSAFVGRYSSNLCLGKCSNNTTDNTKERDIYFCNGVRCKETDFGAVPSGWLGSEN